MTDVRALLKAKRQEARISHPYASYTSAGQLRCTVCVMNVKHASAWEGHLGSKAHRTAVMRVREEARRRAEEEARARRAEEDEEEEEEEKEEEMSGKRKADEENSENGPTKRQKTAEADGGEGFPADFFSDPARTVPSQDEAMNDAPAPQAQSALDAEWENFQKTVLQPAPPPADEARREAFERATVFAEPSIVAHPEGFPASAFQTQQGQEEEGEKDPRVAEEEERRRKAREERELIMDRLLEEERAQEEADARVSVLKGRLEMVKKRREGARARRGKEKAAS